MTKAANAKPAPSSQANAAAASSIVENDDGVDEPVCVRAKPPPLMRSATSSGSAAIDIRSGASADADAAAATASVAPAVPTSPAMAAASSAAAMPTSASHRRTSTRSGIPLLNVGSLFQSILSVSSSQAERQRTSRGSSAIAEGDDTSSSLHHSTLTQSLLKSSAGTINGGFTPLSQVAEDETEHIAVAGEQSSVRSRARSSAQRQASIRGFGGGSSSSSGGTASLRAHLAATFVLDALDSRSVELRFDREALLAASQRSDTDPFTGAQRSCMAWFNHTTMSRSPTYQFVLFLAMIAQMALVAWEPARWADEAFPVGTRSTLLIIDAALTVLLLGDALFSLYALGVERFTEKRWAVVALISLSVYALDLIAAMCLLQQGYTRILRAVRPLPLLNWSVEMRRAVAVMLKSLPRFGDILLCLVVIVTTYALIGQVRSVAAGSDLTLGSWLNVAIINDSRVVFSKCILAGAFRGHLPHGRLSRSEFRFVL